MSIIRRLPESIAQKIAAGEDPKATIRDAKVNECIRLPIAARKELTEGLEREYLSATGTNKPLGGSGLRDFVWLTGQPPEIKQAYLEAMGYAATSKA